MENSGYTLWFTGMSGAGKRTLARQVFERFRLLGRPVQLLTTSDIEPFLPEEVEAPLEVRNRITRLLGWVAELLTRQGVVVVVADISPIREVREESLRRIGRYAEIFVDCSFDVLMEREVGRMYERAMAGELQNVVGVQLPYEPPRQPDVWIDSSETAPEMLAAKLLDGLFTQGFISRAERDVLVGEVDPSTLLAPVVEMRTRRKPAAKKGAAKPAAKKGAAKPAAKKAAAKPAAKKAAAKPAAKKGAAKPAVKKAAAKKAAAKPAAKKAAAKPAAKKAAAKPAAKKAAAKPAAKKATAKPAAKKTAAKKSTAKPAAAARRRAAG